MVTATARHAAEQRSWASRMGAKLSLALAGANLTGAVVTFCYFNFIDATGRSEWAEVPGWLGIGYFIVGFGVIAAAGIVLGRRLTRRVVTDAPDIGDPSSADARSPCRG
jgi:protein-S-isoprenylcysteine O-methyltransferase Ste14